jgi:hypothetical protein
MKYKNNFGGKKNLIPSQHHFGYDTVMSAADLAFVGKNVNAQEQCVSVVMNSSLGNQEKEHALNILVNLTDESIKNYGITPGTWTPLMYDWPATLAARIADIARLKRISMGKE